MSLSHTVPTSPSYALDVGKGDALFGDSPCVHRESPGMPEMPTTHGAWHHPLNLKMLEACGYGHVTQQPPCANPYRGILGGSWPCEPDPSVQGVSKPDDRRCKQNPHGSGHCLSRLESKGLPLEEGPRFWPSNTTSVWSDQMYWVLLISFRK